MTAIGIYSASFCEGDEVCRAVAAQMGYRLVTREVYELGAVESGVSALRLRKALTAPPPFWNKVTQQHQRALAHLGLTLAKLIEAGDVVVSGPAVHLIPGTVHHALRVCLVADLEHRLAVAAGRGHGRAEAETLIVRDDEEKRSWARAHLGADPYDSRLYDLVIPMESTGVDEAVTAICRYAHRLAAQGDDAYRREVADFRLAAAVKVVMADNRHPVGVSAKAGDVTVVLHQYVTRLQHYKEALERLALQVPGVNSVAVKPGSGFVPPSLGREVEIDAPATPSRVLLVDDEREYVQALSERLEIRDFAPSIAYDGEEALAFLQDGEAEVMVLDLKMPGVDGIEVLRRVKRDHPGVEVIILTGYGSERDQRLARELGAFAYLDKPVDINELSDLVRQAHLKIRREQQ